MSATGDCDSEPKKWQCGDPYQYPVTEKGDQWQMLLKPLLEKDHDQCQSWKDEVQNLLIFAGLFSGVITAFVLVSYSSLQPDQDEIMISLLARIATRLDNPLNSTLTSLSETIDPVSLASPVQHSSIQINVFWFISLVLSLTASLIGIVSLQWLREHQQYPSTLSSREKFALFNMRKEGLEAWYVPQIFSSLPLLLQLALTFFFVGLINFLLEVSSTVAIPVVIFMGPPFAFLIFTTTFPALQHFVFLLPLAGRTRQAPQQAPYKSAQSRLFRHLITCSRRVFILCAYFGYSMHRFLFSLPSYVQRWLKKHPQEALEANQRYNESCEGFDSATSDMLFYTLSYDDWLSYDKNWLVMRDAYAQSMFEGRQFTHHDNLFRSMNSAPFYDLTRQLNTLSMFTSLKDFRLCYLCVQDITSSILDSNIFLDKSAAPNRYLQDLMMLGEDHSKRSTTFSSLLVNPPAEFMRDENNFLFLSTRFGRGLPLPTLGQHFSELHVRIANYMYSAKGSLNMRDPLPEEFPSYPDTVLFYHYSDAPGTDANFLSYFEGDISRQFSSLIKAYLEAITSQDLDETTLLKSIHSRSATEWILPGAAIRQSPETVASILDFLSTHIKRSMEGELDKKSDFLFYFSSFYASVLLVPDPSRGYVPWKPKDDEAPTVTDFLQVLRQYLDTRGTPDAALCEQWGTRDTSREWWEFLNTGKDVEDSLEGSSEAALSENSTIHALPATQIVDHLPYAAIQTIFVDKQGQNAVSKMSPDAGDLV